jgi:Leucine-rich repeat (LRR) protein
MTIIILLKIILLNHIFLFFSLQLILIDQKLNQIPEAVINLYHSRVNYLDLSYNKLTALDSLSLFNNVEEIILDNNCISEMCSFPKELQNLKLLSLNNNQVNIDDTDILLKFACLC